MSMIYETSESGRWEDNGSGDKAWTTNWNVEGFTDKGEARLALLANVDVTVDNLIRSTPIVMRQIGPDIWNADVPYKRRNKQVGDIEYEFEIGGGTERVSQGVALQNTYVASGFTAPDFGAALGVTLDGSDLRVDGIDIHVPSKVFKMRCRLSRIQIKTLETITNHITYAPVNQYGWMGYLPHELLFLGSEGGYKGWTESYEPTADDFGEITLLFAASPTAYNIQVGDVLVSFKRGWDRLEVLTVNETDAITKMVVPKVKMVRVVQVYRESNFGLFGFQ